jgi:hypothetical protein
MEYVACWTAEPKRGPFAGCWRVQTVPEGTMVSCREGVIWSKTRQGIKDILSGMGNGHPVRFNGC